jgi:hypothetical protein
LVVALGKELCETPGTSRRIEILSFTEARQETIDLTGAETAIKQQTNLSDCFDDAFRIFSITIGTAAGLAPHSGGEPERSRLLRLPAHRYAFHSSLKSL